MKLNHLMALAPDKECETARLIHKKDQCDESVWLRTRFTASPTNQYKNPNSQSGIRFFRPISVLSTAR